MRTARNAFNKSQNQINIQCGVLVREAKRVQSLFSKEFLALVVNACIGRKKVKGSFRAWQNSNHARMKKTSQMSCVCRSYTNTIGWFFIDFLKKLTYIFSCYLNRSPNEFRIYDSFNRLGIISLFWSRYVEAIHNLGLRRSRK